MGLATELEIRDNVAQIRAALGLYGPYTPNIWAFFSNKNDKLLTILGDVSFIQAVLLEGDPNVHSYEPGEELLPECNHEALDRAGELHVRFKDGTNRWYQCGRHDSLEVHPSSRQRNRAADRTSDAARHGAAFEIRTERDFADRMIEFYNWLTLCSAMTRARNFPCDRELSALLSALEQHDVVLLKDVLNLDDCDPALMMRVVGKGIAKGTICCDLAKTRLSPFSLLTLTNTVVNTEGLTESGVTSQLHDPVERIPQNRRTNCVPEFWRDLKKWPRPEVTLTEKNSEYIQRETAIRMYIYGHEPEYIAKESGLSVSWIRKQFKRCLQKTDDDQIFGFRALVPYTPVAPYTRKSPLPDSNIEKKHGGYSGALKQLLIDHPNYLEIIVAAVLKKRSQMASISKCRGQDTHNVKDKKITIVPESKIKWVELHNEIKVLLKKDGVGPESYPFITADEGYSSLAKLCRSLLYNQPLSWIRARGGKNAASVATTGTGEPSLIEAQGQYQIVQLDFHKHDTPTIVELETPKGDLIDALVPRFWFGCIVDTWNQAIIGTSDSLEPQTTESCVMDLLDSSVGPLPPSEGIKQYAVSRDGCWLPNQIFEPLAHQGWDILKLDRAWAHKATSVISTAIATIGCAICFGRSREWWARIIIERTFGQLTRIGSQRLPSTTGSSPVDPIRDDPEAQAVKYRIRQSEVCDLTKSNARWINEDSKEGVFYSAPFENLRNALAAKNSALFLRPLPRQYHLDRPLNWVTKRCRVEGNSARGQVPSIRIKRCRYRGPELSKAWSLVGQFVFLQVCRRDIRVARVVIEHSGNILGYVLPDKRWLSGPISWRNFICIQEFGLKKRLSSRPVSSVPEYLVLKATEFSQMAGKGGKPNKHDVQRYVNVSRDYNQTKEAAERIVAPQPPEAINRPCSDLEDDVPFIKPFTR